jgi:DNA invertase Pin-like site-specific DNA recombinase
MKVALYARVSTEEQVKHGVSIDAQTSALRRWAEENGHDIVGEYVDNGVSARISPQKRQALQALLRDIPNKKIELVAFTKLDRWTRNVRGYYQVQEILDKHHVAWDAITERYETLSANGRFTVNVLLAVSEQEADRTAERIKTVFDHKVLMGEAITGALPLGLKIVDKRVVPDENAPAALAVFEHYARYGNKQAARNMLQEQHGISLPHLTITHMLQNTLYKGEYRGNPQYCEAIVPPELFDRVQIDLASRSTRMPPSGRVYLFAGLLVCAECGHRLTVCTSGGKRTRYRCPQHYMMKICTHYTSIREDALESQLLDYLTDVVADREVEYAPKQKKTRTNKSAIEGKLSRLRDLYVDGDITKEKYTAERDRLTALLSEKQEQPTKPRIVLGRDFISTYKELPQSGKKLFWREILDHVDVDVDNNLRIYFR